MPGRAVDDEYESDENQILTIVASGVLANDTTESPDSMTVVLVANPSYGNLILNADGSFIYEPNDNFFGTDYFIYKADIGGIFTNRARVTITVHPINDAPVVADTPDKTILEGESFTTINLDDYVSDVDNLDSEITWSYSGNTEPTISIVDRVITISAPVDWFGSETITFRAMDPGGLWDEDTTTFTVNKNEPPEVYYIFLPIIIK